MRKMILIMKCFLVLLVSYTTAWTNTGSFEFIFNQDRPYETININIPRSIWKQAFNPPPFLKSSVTIVVPVHVPQDDNEVEYDADDEVTEINEVIETTVVNDEVIQEVVAETTVIPNVTESSVQDEEITTTESQQVTGQLLRFPCACRNGQCGCCTGAILERFNMKACGNISFIPEDFVFDVRLSVNNNTMIRRRVSASDPPPICFNPRVAPFVRVCAEISNIRIRNRNAFACLDIDADIGGFSIYSASFRCFGLGSSGIQTGLKPKPISSGPKPVNLFGNSDRDDDESGFLQNAASAVLGGGGSESNGLFGGSSSNDDDDGPLDAIGDVVEDLFDGRRLDY
ncbi:uncharacterized protein LOC113518040 [Galleria mellonella]|uniref:Uncharacterized protein LOC113518040 n=1 Tax=Galleria mellonella TaxID=7137 RepID=A0A6J1WZS2_GALME|nr:uncharacterized protein LOC113518040 [Galleria mellonella]